MFDWTNALNWPLLLVFVLIQILFLSAQFTNPIPHFHLKFPTTSFLWRSNPLPPTKVATIPFAACCCSRIFLVLGVVPLGMWTMYFPSISAVTRRRFTGMVGFSARGAQIAAAPRRHKQADVAQWMLLCCLQMPQETASAVSAQEPKQAQPSGPKQKREIAQILE